MNILKTIAIATAGGLDKSPIEGPMFLHSSSEKGVSCASRVAAKRRAARNMRCLMGSGVYSNRRPLCSERTMTLRSSVHEIGASRCRRLGQEAEQQVGRRRGGRLSRNTRWTVAAWLADGGIYWP